MKHYSCKGVRVCYREIDVVLLALIKWHDYLPFLIESYFNILGFKNVKINS